jgi:hypothetical protein
MPGENQNCFAEGKIYKALSYHKKAGYRVVDDLDQSHWIYEPGNKFFDRHSLMIDEESDIHDEPNLV